MRTVSFLLLLALVCGGLLITPFLVEREFRAPLFSFVFNYSLLLLLVVFGTLIYKSFSARREFAHKRFVPAAQHDSEPKRINEAAFVSQTLETAFGELCDQRDEMLRASSLQAERAIRAETFSRQIVASLPSGLIACDAFGTVRIFNDPAKIIFAQELNVNTISIDYRKLFESAPALIKIIERTLTRRETFSRVEIDCQITVNVRKKLGLTVSPLIVGAETNGVLCLVTDLTEVHKLREQQALERSLADLGVMSAGIAHEFKNSLAALQSYAQLLQRTHETEIINQAATGLNCEVSRLSQMVTAFLDFARPQNVALDSISLDDVLRDCLAEQKVLFEKFKIEVRVEPNLGIVRADRILLNQAFGNLIRNAVEAVCQVEQPRRISINRAIAEIEPADQMLRLEIADNGAGISEVDLPYLFVPFFTTKPEGHGIGLALTHRIVALHAGTLSVSPNYPAGSIFTLTLKR